MLLRIQNKGQVGRATQESIAVQRNSRSGTLSGGPRATSEVPSDHRHGGELAQRKGNAHMKAESVSVQFPRRQQLLGIAGERVSHRGFAGTGVDEIGEAAGVTGPALYRHFANKQAILDALVVEGMERLMKSAQAAA